MEDQEVFMLYDEEGNEAPFVELFNFDLDDGSQSYIVLRPAEVEVDSDMPVIPFRYNKDAEDGSVLDQIETDEEFDMVEEVMNTILDAGQI